MKGRQEKDGSLPVGIFRMVDLPKASIPKVISLKAAPFPGTPMPPSGTSGSGRKPAPSPSPPKTRLSMGFTLVEVMIFLLILGIVATAGLPNPVSGLDGARLSGAAGEIVSAVEFAQLTAMCTGCRTRVTVDAAENTILVEGFRTGVDPSGTETELDEEDVEEGNFETLPHPLDRGRPYSVDLDGEDRFRGVDISSSVFGGGNFVIFGTLGAPSSGGTLTLSLGSRTLVLTINSLTGKITSG